MRRRFEEKVITYTRISLKDSSAIDLQAKWFSSSNGLFDSQSGRLLSTQKVGRYGAMR